MNILLAALLAVPVRASGVASGAALAPRIPAGGYAAASPAWVGAVHAQLTSGLFSAADPGFSGSMLPALAKTQPAEAQNHSHAQPLIYYLTRDLGLDLKTFQAMSEADKRDALLLAAQEAASSIKWDASIAITRATEALYPPGGYEDAEAVAKAARDLREFAGKYALYLPQGTLEEIRDLHKRAEKRVRALRRVRVEAKGGEIAGRLEDGKAKLSAADIGLAVTRDFEYDTDSFTEMEWERLKREFEKVRALIAGGEPLRGEIGNVKFLAGPLSGLGEIKFGTNRTHRVFFKYHAKSRKIVFLKILAREAMNKNSGRLQDLAAYREDYVLEARMRDPSPDMPLMKKVEAADLDIRLNP